MLKSLSIFEETCKSTFLRESRIVGREPDDNVTRVKVTFDRVENMRNGCSIKSRRGVPFRFNAHTFLLSR